MRTGTSIVIRAATFLLAAVAPVSAQCDFQSFTGTGEQHDQYRLCLDQDGPVVVVGAPLEDNELGAGAGTAYIYAYADESWTLVQRLTAPDGLPGDGFGWGAAIAGDLIVVGAPGRSGVGPASGTAYAFTYDGAQWVPAGHVDPPDPTAEKRFGMAVALSGNRVAIDASEDSEFALYGGAVYVYHREASGTWTWEAKLHASNVAAYDRFGRALDLEGDLLVAGRGIEGHVGPAEQAWVFQANGTAWTEVQILQAAQPVVNDEFGSAIEIEGDVIYVGAAPAAYAFLKQGGSWQPVQELLADGMQFGWAMWLAADGDRVIVGGSEPTMVWRRSGESWALERTLLPAHASAFGPVALSDADDVALVAGLGSTWRVYGFLLADVDTDGDGVFDRCDNCPLMANAAQADCNHDGEGDLCRIASGASADCDVDGIPDDCSIVQTLTAPAGVPAQGFGAALAVEGSLAVIGAPNAQNQGAAFVYRYNGAAWVPVGPLTPADLELGAHFGWRVDFDGGRALVAAYGAEGAFKDEYVGAAYVFDLDAGGEPLAEHKLTASDLHSIKHDSPYFGTSVALRGDLALVGAYADNVDGHNYQGSAYVFRYDGTAGTWVQEAKLTADDGEAEDYFGWAVAWAGTSALVTALYADLGNGAVYVFEHNQAGKWGLVQKVARDVPGLAQAFGAAVAAEPGLMAVGNPADGPAYPFPGAVYTFRLDQAGHWTQEQRISPPQIEDGAQFGFGLRLDGGRLLVGASDKVGINGFGTGAAYLFEPDASGSWAMTRTIEPPDGALLHQGYSVELSGVHAMLGTSSYGPPSDSSLATRVRVRCAGDLDDDGIVGLDDITLLFAAWGACPAAPETCNGDFDHDGQVDVNDFLILLSAWGA